MLEPIEKLSESGEVAVFIDDDQFDGRSVMTCGYEIGSIFWHSTEPGRPNFYTSAQIHAMAVADYEHFNGPDTASNQRGMTNEELYADLAMHRFSCVKLPKDWNTIRAWLAYGVPVIVGGVLESSVFDLEIGDHVPYPWIRPGQPDYTHVIMATGLENPTSLKFRDSANVDADGHLRPGPRRYSTTEMSYATATAVIPTWLTTPPADWNPVYPVPPKTPPVDFAAIRKLIQQVEAESGELLKLVPVA